MVYHKQIPQSSSTLVVQLPRGKGGDNKQEAVTKLFIVWIGIQDLIYKLWIGNKLYI